MLRKLELSCLIIWYCGELYKIKIYPKSICDYYCSEVIKGPISLEKYWYYFHCPKNVLGSILSFVFWTFPPSDTAVQLESTDSKQNAISKSLFHDNFGKLFGQWEKCIIYIFWKKRHLPAIKVLTDFSWSAAKKNHYRIKAI